MNRESYDIVIIGCGIAGLTAGLRATEMDRSVVLLEKAPEENRGGHTQFAESFRIPTADVDVDATFNVEDYSSGDFYSDIMKVTNFRADQELAERVSKGAVETFEWLTDLGIDWEYQAPHPGYTAGRVWIDGGEMVAELVGIVEDRGGEIHYEAEARELYREDDGSVTGVGARVDGMWTRYDGDAIILASGDYGSSKERRTR